MGEIALAEMIRSLRDELQQAQEEGQGKGLRFTVGEVELELQVTVTKEGEGSAGVKFWVYDAAIKGKVAEQAVQKIKLKLTPVGADGIGSVLVNDARQLGDA